MKYLFFFGLVLVGCRTGRPERKLLPTDVKEDLVEKVDGNEAKSANIFYVRDTSIFFDGKRSNLALISIPDSKYDVELSDIAQELASIDFAVLSEFCKLFPRGAMIDLRERSDTHAIQQSFMVKSEAFNGKEIPIIVICDKFTLNRLMLFMEIVGDFPSLTRRSINSEIR